MTEGFAVMMTVSGSYTPMFLAPVSPCLGRDGIGRHNA